MRNVSLEIHKYDELDEVGRKAARGWFRRTLDDDFSIETESITESFIYTLQEAGYMVPDSNRNYNIEWSLASCQGDGVGFKVEMSGLDTYTLIERLRDERSAALWKRIDVACGLTITVTKGRGYYVTGVNVEIGDYYEKHGDMVTALEQDILDDARRTCHQLETSGYADIEYYYSRETIEENIRSNEYEFTADGKPWPR